MKKTLYLIGLFFFSAAIGLGVSKLLKLGSQESDYSVDIAGSTSAANGDEKAKILPDTATVTVTPKSTTPILVVSEPSFNGKSYFFSASCKGVASNISYHYELWSSKLVAKSSDGVFRNIPASPSGSYKLCLVNNETGTNIVAPKEVHGFKKSEVTQEKQESRQGISAQEFQRRMLTKGDHTLDGGRNSLVSRNLRINVVGMHDDEGGKPTDIQGIKDKIEFGIWKSATVVGSLTYDASGLVTSVTVSPVY